MDCSVFINEPCCSGGNTLEDEQMKYFVYDEDGMLMRGFQTRGEAEKYLQAGWTIKFRKIIKRDGYSEALMLGEAVV